MKSIIFTSTENTPDKAINNAFDEFNLWVRSHIGEIVSLSHHIIKDDNLGSSYLATIIVVVTNH